jgi:hypothetical protein
MKKFSNFLQESSLGRVLSHTKDRNLGIITAHRHNPALSAEENAKTNKANNQSLMNDIRKAGFGYIHVKGRYVENMGTPQQRNVDEHSFMVIGHKEDHEKLKNFLKEHGEKYNQDSVLFKKHDNPDAHLIGTTHRDSWIKHGEEKSVGTFHPSRAGEFHSVLRGRTFAFAESVEPTVTDIKFTINTQTSFFSRGKSEEIDF